MAIAFTEQPNPDKIYPVGNCIKYLVNFLGERDLGIRVQAAVEITFNDGEPQVDGEQFTFWGKQFYVTNVGTYEGNSVNLTSALGATNRTNFIDCVTNYLPFGGLLLFSLTGGPGVNSVLFTMAECGYQEDFDFDFSQLSFPMYYVELQAQDSQLPEGYKFVYRLSVLNELQITDVPKDGFCLVTELPLYVHQEMAKHVKTTLPDLADIIEADFGMIGQFYLYYGSRINSTSQGVVFSSLQVTDTCFVINSRINLENLIDEDNPFNPYTYDGSNLGAVKFLNHTYYKMKVCRSEDFWYYIYIPEEISGTAIVDVRVNFIGYNEAGQVASEVLTAPKTTGSVIYFRGMPANIFNNDAVCYYTIQVQVNAGGWVDYSEELILPIYSNDCNCENTFLWLDSLGGFSALWSSEITEVNSSLSFSEFCREQCLTFEGGKITMQSILNTSYLVDVKIKTRYKGAQDFINDFLQSNERYIVLTVDGEKQRVRIIVESGDYSIFQSGENKKFQFAFKFAHQRQALNV